jgi:anthranilate synthase component 1
MQSAPGTVFSGIQPDLAEVRTLAAQGLTVPISRTIPADLETPVSAYLKIAQGDYSFLLESVQGSESLGRYSFIGTNPYKVIRMVDGTATLTEIGEQETKTYDGPLKLLEEELDKTEIAVMPGLPRFQGGAVGYLSYDTVRYFEPRVPLPAENTLPVPEAIFMFTDSLIMFDHVKHSLTIIAYVSPHGDVTENYATAVAAIDEINGRLHNPVPTVRGTGDSGIAVPNKSEAQHHEMVRAAKEYIAAGDIIQSVLGLRWSRQLGVHPYSVYRALRMVNPSPYMYYLDLDDVQIVGASPEMLVRVEGSHVTTRPIAGTRRRGTTPAEDAALAEELLASEKERAEHIMLVDLGRNDLGRVCRPGTVHVPTLMLVEEFSHVMHIVSQVEGELLPDKTAFDALRSCFPAGTLSGAPKVRAMEIISELEGTTRGPYGGAVGYFDYSGNMDMAITIRTMTVQDGTAYIQAGGGIVADSDPEEEYQEVCNKAASTMRAIDVAEEMERDLHAG